MLCIEQENVIKWQSITSNFIIMPHLLEHIQRDSQFMSMAYCNSFKGYKIYKEGVHNPWEQNADTPSMWLEHSDSENKETSHGNDVKA